MIRTLMAAIVLAPATSALGAGTTFTADLPTGEGGASVRVAPARTASMTVSVRAPRGVPVRLRLSGRGAPSGVLLDTRSGACGRSGGWRVCRLRVRPLPRGVYFWEIDKAGGPAGKVVLSIRW